MRQTIDRPALILMFVAALLVQSNDPSSGGILLLVGLAIGIGLIGVLVAAIIQRPIRHRVRPQLVRALSRLRPSEAEIGDALGHMDSLALRIGRKLKARQVHAWLREGRVSKEPKTRRRITK